MRRGFGQSRLGMGSIWGNRMKEGALIEMLSGSGDKGPAGDDETTADY